MRFTDFQVCGEKNWLATGLIICNTYSVYACWPTPFAAAQSSETQPPVHGPPKRKFGEAEMDLHLLWSNKQYAWLVVVGIAEEGNGK
jgi:hypothetical protein